jgi:hypothetical protein
MAELSLYDKRATVKIGDKEFSGPPFSIYFELSQSLSSPSKVNCLLYNPNDDTIAKCESRQEGKKTIFTQAELSGGYVNDIGVTASGSIKKFDVYRQGQDRILDLQIFDNEKWRDQWLNKSFRDTKVSAILDEVIGDRPSRVTLGEDKVLKDFRVRDRYSAIDKLCEISESQFALRNGVVTIQPKGFVDSRVFNLDYTSGLAEIPEKIDRPKTKDQASFTGYKIKTLYIYGLEIWSSVRVQTPATVFNGIEKPGLDIKGVVIGCIKKFSTFEDSLSEYTIRLT